MHSSTEANVHTTLVSQPLENEREKDESRPDNPEINKVSYRANESPIHDATKGANELLAQSEIQKKEASNEMIPISASTSVRLNDNQDSNPGNASDSKSFGDQAHAGSNDVTEKVTISPEVAYRVSFINEWTKNEIHSMRVRELPKEYTKDGSGIFTVMEVIEPRLVHWDSLPTMYAKLKDKGDSDAVELKDLPPSSSKHELKIKILSPALLEVLRCVVDYYPEFSFNESQVTVSQPFEIFHWYRDALTEMRELLAPEICQDESCQLRNARRHIDIVQDFVYDRIGQSVAAETVRHEKGMATFEMLWMLFRPGDDVYYDKVMLKEYEPYVVKDLNWTTEHGAITSYTIVVWNISANALVFGPKETTVIISSFAGEQDINSLRLIPRAFFKQDHKGRNAKETWDFFVERGKRFCKLQTKGCWSFDGISTTFPRRSFNDYAMTDPIQVETNESHLEATVETEFEPNKRYLSGNYCSSCKSVLDSRRKEFKFAKYSNVHRATHDQFTDHQYFLCDVAVPAFLFKTRDWRFLDVTGFKEPEYDGSILDTLVLDRAVKDLVLNLTRKYVQTRQIEQSINNSKPPMALITETEGTVQWTADFVKGKGEGLIFLLHGRPGVGKTYTAECISAKLERPLISLTCADLGTDPERIEQNLVKWFKLAASWNAILLIDEADIYMEHRHVQDLDRNNLVACLLRAMEYYKGILFLTTNRVGHFDEAFISRINIAIYYDDFTPEDRQGVWNSFFSKLEREREGIFRITESTKDYVAENKELQSLNWNGREIRNAFQIAVSLAEVEGDKDNKGRVLVKPAHITSTLRMSKKFKDYLEKLRQKSLESMAAHWGNRLDAYGKKPDPSQAFE